MNTASDALNGCLLRFAPPEIWEMIMMSVFREKATRQAAMLRVQNQQIALMISLDLHIHACRSCRARDKCQVKAEFAFDLWLLLEEVRELTQK